MSFISLLPNPTGRKPSVQNLPPYSDSLSYGQILNVFSGVDSPHRYNSCLRYVWGPMEPKNAPGRYQ